MAVVAEEISEVRLYAPRRAWNQASDWTRVLAIGLSIGCLTLLVLASRLTPSAAGVGSHQGLGLQRCQMLQQTGVPCPSCGMTTSFSWFARGNLAASFYIQPMGMLLALAAAICVWAGAYVAVTGRPVYRLATLYSGRSYMIGLLGFGILAWGWKVFIHLYGMDGWR